MSLTVSGLTYQRFLQGKVNSMDLGIEGRHAIVCASSRGLGRGCAEKLAEAGVHLTLNGRSEEPLRTLARDLGEKYNIEVRYVTADVTTESGRKALLAAQPDPDILINNAGGPPAGLWSDWGETEWLKAIGANMLTPILLTTAVLPGMIERGWGRIVNITSASVKSPIPQLGLSNASRAGLTGFVAGTARQVADRNVTINNLLPGPHDTDRIEALVENTARQQNISRAEARAGVVSGIPAKRLGTSEEFGAACAFLCSTYAGFIVGQNILLDGGSFNSTMG
jgi:3-oxoacyl-[acyl-carrier protein] reductase